MEGSAAAYARGAVNIAFRCGVGQADKLRSFGDLKHNEVNLYCAAWDPINLPTLGHIAQMRLGAKHTKRACEFFKPDREAAYEQLPIRSERANLAMVALRDPATSKWTAFHPKALLFGDTSEAPRYNWFSLLLGALFNRIFGIPLIGYFDGFGALAPKNLGSRVLRNSESFCRALGIQLDTTKTDRCQEITSLRLRGASPTPSGNMLLIIDLPSAKATRWAS